MSNKPSSKEPVAAVTAEGAGHAPVQLTARSVGLDPRRARMLREVDGFGLEWRASVEAGRLLAAMALGSVLTFALVGPRTTTADAPVHRSAAMPTPATPLGDVATAPDARNEPELLAPRPSPVMEDTPQRDVHSDGGGH